MSTNLTQFIWPTSFVCTIVTENLVLPTSYTISVSVDPSSGSQLNINTGFRKLRSFVDIKLQNSVFISKDSKLHGPLTEIGNNRVLFPTEPYDFFVGCILYNKFLSITHEYFQIDFISIDSAIGDHVQYTIGDPAESGLDLDGDFWWNKDTLDTGTGDDILWDDLDIGIATKFEPRIIQGGLSENK